MLVEGLSIIKVDLVCCDLFLLGIMGTIDLQASCANMTFGLWLNTQLREDSFHVSHIFALWLGIRLCTVLDECTNTTHDGGIPFVIGQPPVP